MKYPPTINIGLKAAQIKANLQSYMRQITLERIAPRTASRMAAIDSEVSPPSC